MKKRSTTIDFFRIVFAVAIVIFHGKQVFTYSNNTYSLFINGAYGVDFFFIVSGFLFTKTVYEKCCLEGKSEKLLGTETISYLKKRYFAILPYHIIAFGLTFIVQVSIHSYGVDTIQEVIAYLIASLPQLFLIQISGVYLKNVSSVTWYLSALFLSILVLYPLLRKYYDIFSKVITPVLFLVMWGWLLNVHGSLLGNWAEWDGFIFFGAIKGGAEMLIGVMTFNFSQLIQRKGPYLSHIKVKLTLLELLGYLLLLFHMCQPNDNTYSFVLVPIVAVSIALSFSKNTYSNDIIRGRWIELLSNCTLPLYLNQMWCRYIVQNYAKKINTNIGNKGGGELFFYCCISIIIAIAMSFIVKRMSKRKNVGLLTE